VRRRTSKNEERVVDLKLRGRVALVTGSSKGIGAAVAESFAAEGCNLILAARSADLLCEKATALKARHSVDVKTIALDLSKEQDRQQLLAQFPLPDIVINNAGDLPAGTIDQIDDQRWRESWDLKVFGYINLTRSYYSGMSERGSGVIINIIGISGERVDANYIVGSTGNAALMAFSRALGGVSLRKGVRVLAVNPGPVATERVERILQKKANRELGDPARWKELTKAMPLGRPATCEEIAPMVTFLSSDLNSYTSGAVFTIDGGMSSTISIA
jgi:NAD(P)-dependent dehydrogenase (short-subunit alcohol dehydrogenase family)